MSNLLGSLLFPRPVVKSVAVPRQISDESMPRRSPDYGMVQPAILAALKQREELGGRSLTPTAIAAIVGHSYESVCRAVRILKKRNLIVCTSPDSRGVRRTPAQWALSHQPEKDIKNVTKREPKPRHHAKKG